MSEKRNICFLINTAFHPAGYLHFSHDVQALSLNQETYFTLSNSTKVYIIYLLLLRETYSSDSWPGELDLSPWARYTSTSPQLVNQYKRSTLEKKVYYFYCRLILTYLNINLSHHLTLIFVNYNYVLLVNFAQTTLLLDTLDLIFF